MQWDFRDQLLMTRRQAVNAGDADGTAHQGERTCYVYDGAGQRARKTTQSAAGAKIKERFYIGALEVYREYDGAGNTVLERQTLQRDGRQSGESRWSKRRPSTSPPPRREHYPARPYAFSSTIIWARHAWSWTRRARVITYEEYYPYGSTSYQAGRSLAEVSLKRYRYTGKERDEETGLEYHGARYYACWLGRWISCDPKGLVDGNNLYRYVRCNPIRLLDPHGTEPQDKKGTAPTDTSAGKPKGPAPSGDLQKQVQEMNKEVAEHRAKASELLHQSEEALGQAVALTGRIKELNKLADAASQKGDFAGAAALSKQGLELAHNAYDLTSQAKSLADQALQVLSEKTYPPEVIEAAQPSGNAPTPPDGSKAAAPQKKPLVALYAQAGAALSVSLDKAGQQLAGQIALSMKFDRAAYTHNKNVKVLASPTVTVTVAGGSQFKPDTPAAGAEAVSIGVSAYALKGTVKLGGRDLDLGIQWSDQIKYQHVEGVQGKQPTYSVTNVVGLTGVGEYHLSEKTSVVLNVGGTRTDAIDQSAGAKPPSHVGFQTGGFFRAYF